MKRKSTKKSTRKSTIKSSFGAKGEWAIPLLTLFDAYNELRNEVKDLSEKLKKCGVVDKPVSSPSTNTSSSIDENQTIINAVTNLSIEQLGEYGDALGKYARMHKAGLPDGAIRNALTRDGLDPEKQLKDLQITSATKHPSFDLTNASKGLSKGLETDADKQQKQKEKQEKIDKLKDEIKKLEIEIQQIEDMGQSHTIKQRKDMRDKNAEIDSKKKELKELGAPLVEFGNRRKLKSSKKKTTNRSYGRVTRKVSKRKVTKRKTTKRRSKN